MKVTCPKSDKCDPVTRQACGHGYPHEFDANEYVGCAGNPDTDCPGCVPLTIQMWTCKTCNGTGEIHLKDRSGNPYSTTCYMCGGRGEVGRMVEP
jgi:DnaJ-class molecular chaperone